MEQQSPAGYAALMNLNEKITALIGTVRLYKDNKKALKFCAKLVKADKNFVKQSSLPVSDSAGREILWRYDELATAVKNLASGNLEGARKASCDIDSIAARTEQEIENIRENLHPVKTNAQKLTEAVTDVAQKLKQSVGKAVSEKVDQIKKKIAESAAAAVEE